METKQLSETGTKRNISTRNVIIIAILVATIGTISLFVLRGKPATDIAFYNDTIEIIIGDIQKLDYTILPSDATSKSVKWESSNSSIVNVSEQGKITAISEGEAVITVTTSNGKIDECLVTVKPTAFDYLKRMGDTAEGYTVGNYRVSSGTIVSIGFAYNRSKDALYIMTTSDDRNLATIVIPSSLSGNYDGIQEMSYSSATVRTLYSIDASTLTSNTDITSYYCESNSRWKNNSWDAPNNDAVYTAKVHTMLLKVYQEVLEPAGYTYADLGFTSYS